LLRTAATSTVVPGFAAGADAWAEDDDEDDDAAGFDAADPAGAAGAALACPKIFDMIVPKILIRALLDAPH